MLPYTRSMSQMQFTFAYVLSVWHNSSPASLQWMPLRQHDQTNGNTGHLQWMPCGIHASHASDASLQSSSLACMTESNAATHEKSPFLGKQKSPCSHRYAGAKLPFGQGRAATKTENRVRAATKKPKPTPYKKVVLILGKHIWCTWVLVLPIFKIFKNGVFLFFKIVTFFILGIHTHVLNTRAKFW
jgi:hypothetical protein